MQRYLDSVIQALLRNKPAQEIFLPSDVNKIIDNMHHYRPLHIAVIYSSNRDTFLYLLQHGASLESTDRAGNTPIGLAMRYNNKTLWEALELLRQGELSKSKLNEERLHRISKDNQALLSSNEKLQSELDKLRSKNDDLQNSFENLTHSLRKKRKIDSVYDK